MKTSTRYALLLLLISGLLGTLANQYRPIAPVISWVGASFGLMGILYLRPGKPFVGKTEFGALTPAWQLVLWPYLLMTRGLWMLQINSSSEPCCQLLAPKLWLGRRPKADEIPEEVDWIIDLTAEFARPGNYPSILRYSTLPTLDHTELPPQALQLAQKIAAFDGVVYIHCALGHGRSAALAAMVMVLRGNAKTVADAEKQIQGIRSRVKLTSEQRDMAENSLQTLRQIAVK